MSHMKLILWLTFLLELRADQVRIKQFAIDLRISASFLTVFVDAIKKVTTATFVDLNQNLLVILTGVI